MHPRQLAPGTDPTEKKVFTWLCGLPADCLVYHEPAVGHRYPDIVVILPALGLLVIKVKAWKLDRLRRANAHEFVFADAADQLEKPAPHSCEWKGSTIHSLKRSHHDRFSKSSSR